jgi:hypothetical protein
MMVTSSIQEKSRATLHQLDDQVLLADFTWWLFSHDINY